MASQPSISRNQVAAEARKRFMTEIGRTMVDVTTACQEHLTSLLNESVRAREAQTRRDAWTFYQKARGPWLDGTVKGWQKALLPPTASTKLDLTAETFQLVGTDVVDNKILVSRLARAAQDKLSGQIDDLKIRMRALEGHAEFQDHDIFRPEVVLLQVVEQWSKAGMQRDAWPLVHDIVQRLMTDRMLLAFTQVNEFLIKQGVMPTIELKDRVKKINSAESPQAPRPVFRPSAHPEEQNSRFGIDSTGEYAAPSPPSARGSYGNPSPQGRSPQGYPQQPQQNAQPGQAHPQQGQSYPQQGQPYPQQGQQYSQQGQQYPQNNPGSGPQGHGPNQTGGQAPFGGRLDWGGGANQPQGGATARRAPGGASAGDQADTIRSDAYRSSGPKGVSGRSHLPGQSQAPGQRGASDGRQGPQGSSDYSQAPQGQQEPHQMSAQQAARHQEAYEGAHEETRMLTATTPLARARSRAQGVMGQLKRLLVGRLGPEAEAGSTDYYRPSPRLAEAIAVRPSVDRRGADYGDGGTVVDEYTPAGVARVAGRLREETNELKKKAETKNEKATIEIVALMFQAILQEDRIPPGIRVWFARLQMPVLRVALEEPDFFGTLNHPARQLIDRMGSVVMGFDASGVHGNAMEVEVKRIVQVIEQYPETGKRVYQLVYEEFQKFLAKFLTEKGVAQKVVSVAQQVEQKETLTIQYTIEMRNMLKDIAAPEEIREFLFKVWAEVLAVAAIRKGPQNAETLDLKKCSSELVWSASAKPNRADRAKVIAELPKLLQRLRAGMTLLGLAPTVQDGHIKKVSDTLADAFMSKTKVVPQEQIEVMAKRLENLEDFISEDGMGDLPLDAESIELMLGIDPATIDVIADGGSKPNNAMVAWANELQVGAWFTLDHNSRVTRVQFAWRSERRHLNLFASVDGHTYLIQAGRLAAYLQAGLLLPQEEETLTVRATRDALAKLEANPERLLG